MAFIDFIECYFKKCDNAKIQSDNIDIALELNQEDRFGIVKSSWMLTYQNKWSVVIHWEANTINTSLYCNWSKTAVYASFNGLSCFWCKVAIGLTV